jgi:Protein of unknown function (DUF3761)
MSLLPRSISVVALAALLFTSLSAQTPQPSPNQPTSQQQKSQPKCTDNGTYVNSKGETVKRPENCSAAPQGATAQYRDGSYSFSQSRRGTCSHHGDVAKWLKPPRRSSQLDVAARKDICSDFVTRRPVEFRMVRRVGQCRCCA